MKKHTLSLSTYFCRRNLYMPYVTVKMLEGRNEEQKKALVEKVTAAVVETTGASEDKVVVFIEEMSKNHYAVGGKRLSDE
ncbi:2-hydroxymuconate tautomerase [Lederbergia panacisoli]|uniref:2-hydroxymuconate tautomerase n=1 Tax=Lederbergia panacisoli TaxID=1255251 RepID=UPI00214BBC41|nr:4-oxalocrotonate tautomerase [Lederbergia panacisoli]